MIREFIVTFSYFLNLPDYSHNESIIIEGYTENEAIKKVYSKYPNVSNLSINETETI